MMAARQIAARCPSCSVTLLNFFLGTTQLRIPTVRRLASRGGPVVVPRRAFGGGTVRFEKGEGLPGRIERDLVVEEEVVEVVVVEEGTVRTELLASRTEVIEEPKPTSQPIPETTLDKPADVPWFLRVETPVPASHPFAARQALPALPPTPPPALSSLLNHLSTDLGITDLALIDLRSMDPPPAIGTSTIMIVGNARSERHLHISADKTCRWLRSEYKMTPYADGLLGRGEVKIKNRRLKKRGRLINTQTGQVEGVGWICVDVGSQGLVVQLFTRGRREEIDLEGLWGKFVGKGAAITRAANPVEEARKQREKEEEEEEEEDVEVKYRPPLPVIRLGVGLSQGSGGDQRRGFHTSAWRPLELYSATPPAPPPPPPYQLVDRIKFRGINIQHCVEHGHYWELTDQLPRNYKPAARSTIANHILRAQINHLKITYPGVNPTATLLEGRTGPCMLLGSGQADTTSTDFLRTFHANLAAPVPNAKKFCLHLELLAEAHRIHPQAYPADCLLAHLNTIIAANIPPHALLYFFVFRALSTSPPLRFTPDLLLSTLDTAAAHMKTHCPQLDATIPEIQLSYLHAVAPPHLPTVLSVASSVCLQSLATANKPTEYVISKYQHLHVGTYTLHPLIHKIDAAVSSANHAYTLREYQEALLTVYAMGGCWTAFWNRWKSMRYMGIHRDAEMYALVVGLLVMGENQRECVNAARWLPVDMGREVPGVGLTAGMARGVLKMLEIAEGGAKSGEFKELRERCEGVVERVGRKWEMEKARLGGVSIGNNVGSSVEASGSV